MAGSVLAAFWSEPVAEAKEVFPFSTATVARWTILSSRAATASGRCFPSAFGMYVRRDGSARYAPR